jgi:hypothetical protein
MCLQNNNNNLKKKVKPNSEKPNTPYFHSYMESTPKIMGDGGGGGGDGDDGAKEGGGDVT